MVRYHYWRPEGKCVLSSVLHIDAAVLICTGHSLCYTSEWGSLRITRMVQYHYWRREDKFVLSSVTHIDHWIFSVNLSTCDSVASSSADHAVRQHRAHGPRPPSSDSRDLGVRSHVFQRFLLFFKTGSDWSGRSWSIFGSVARGTGRRRRWSRSRRQRCLSSPLHCSLSSIVRSPLSRMWTLPGQFLSGACTKIGRLYQTLSVRSDSSSSESVITTRWREISVVTILADKPWLHIRNNTKDEIDFPYNIEIH